MSPPSPQTLVERTLCPKELYTVSPGTLPFRFSLTLPNALSSFLLGYYSSLSLHPFCSSIPSVPPPLLSLHPFSVPSFSPSVPSFSPSLLFLCPSPFSTHSTLLLCPQPVCSPSSKLLKSRVWSLFLPFLLARTWCFQVLVIGSCCSKNSGRYRGPPSFIPLLPGEGRW